VPKECPQFNNGMIDSELQILEDYVFDRLSESQKLEVDLKLQTNVDWHAAYQKILVLKEASQRQILRDQIGILQKRKLEEWNSQRPSIGRILRWPKYLATGMAAGVACFLYLNWSSVSFPQELDMNERGRESSMQSDDLQNITRFKEGQMLMKAKNFKMAQQAFYDIEKNTKVSLYYRDMALWLQVVALSEYDEFSARKLLTQIESNSEFSYKIPYLDLMKIKTRLLF
jgi:hypothetical protein